MAESGAALTDAGNDVSVDRIEDAARTIDPVFLNSRQFQSGQLSGASRATVVVKVETANPLRSFKGRGADYFFLTRVETTERPLVCASAGNFGQAMAYAARKHGLGIHV